MKRKSVIITGIIAVAIIAIVAVVLFMKNAPISDPKPKKEKAADHVPGSDDEAPEEVKEE